MYIYIYIGIATLCIAYFFDKNETTQYTQESYSSSLQVSFNTIQHYVWPTLMDPLELKVRIHWPACDAKLVSDISFQHMQCLLIQRTNIYVVFKSSKCVAVAMNSIFVLVHVLSLLLIFIFSVFRYIDHFSYCIL